MATNTPSVDGNMGAFDVVGTAFAVAMNDLRIAGLQVVSGIFAIVPFLGPLLATVTSGLAMQFADEAVGNDGPRNSIGERFVFGLITSIVVSGIVTVGLFFLVFPGIYLALKLTLAVPSVWVGDEGPIEALSDSWERTSGNLLTILGVGVLCVVVGMVLLVPVLVLAFGGSAVTASAELGVGFAFTSPLLVVGSLVVAVTIGSVSVAAQTVMYRSFGGTEMRNGAEMRGGSDDFGRETQF